MHSELFTLRASLEMCIVFLCFFGTLFFLASNRKEDKWLVLIYIAHLWVVLALMVSGEVFDLMPPTPLLVTPAPLIILIPALYFYTHDLVKPNAKTWSSRWMHFLPFLLTYFAWLYFGREDPVRKIVSFNGHPSIVFFSVLVAVTFLLYGMKTLRLIAHNEKKYQDEFAGDYLTLNLRWIKWITYPLVAVPILTVITVQFVDETPDTIKYVAVPLTMLLTLGILSFFAFRQPVLYREEVLEAHQASERKVATPPQIEPAPAPSLLWENGQKEEYIRRIEEHFAEAKPYLNPTIRMPELARSLNIPRHVFSALINEHYQVNFFNFINRHRVEYAKTLLLDETKSQYTLETIGEMAGFNSRSTFNKRFKELVGMSPKDYLKQKLKENQDIG